MGKKQPTMPTIMRAPPPAESKISPIFSYSKPVTAYPALEMALEIKRESTSVESNLTIDSPAAKEALTSCIPSSFLMLVITAFSHPSQVMPLTSNFTCVRCSDEIALTSELDSAFLLPDEQEAEIKIMPSK